jgi:uncharacterized protein YecE (DUF72 family)
MARLRIGTCSWKFDSWQGLVYSAPRGINYLEEYAARYDTVEIDRWFWSLFGHDNVRLPRPLDVEEYRRSVPDDFRFTVKAPNSITLTHFYKAAKGDPLVPNPYFFFVPLFREFLSLLGALHDVLGPLMFQFEYLNRRKMASQSRFQDNLEVFAGRLPPGYEYAVEVRNPRFLNESFFRFLGRNGLSPVLLQGYWMPQIARVYEEWRALIIEHEVIVIRLLGPDRKGIEEQTGKRWDRIVAPKDEELRAIVDVAQDLLSNGVSVYLNVNNHYEGSAPLTVERIRRLFNPT